jgi:flagellar biosynthesis anti-sigma factor FlgM
MGVPMKITTTGQPPVMALDPQQKKSPVAAMASELKPAQKPGGEAFRVEISKSAAQAKETAKADEINFEKVAAIRDQLAAGTYSISGRDVANKILKALMG